jgi:hypothetical protein
VVVERMVAVESEEVENSLFDHMALLEKDFSNKVKERNSATSPVK